MRIVLFIAFLTLISSCNNQTGEEVKPVVKGKTLVQLPVDAQDVAGTYIGEFKGSPIAITLTYVGNGHASGYNIHKGLKRNVSGTVDFVDGKLQLKLSEPGNNQFDGKFDLSIDTTTWGGKGNWKPMNKGDEVSFSFKKQARSSDDYDDPFNAVYLDDRQDALQLKGDGSCTYSYMTDSTNTAQQITIRGNYSMSRDSVITVFWQNNNAFPSRKSTFKMKSEFPDKESDFSYKVLKGEGKEFTQMIF